jgi:F-type H+/Na+-transporting ATPase subunit alpha
MQTQTQTFRIKETGTVKEVKKFIVKIEGLPSCMSGQRVIFPDGASGLVMGFNEKEALVIAMGYEANIRIGSEILAESIDFRIPASEAFIGRIINALGEPCDGGGPISAPVIARRPKADEATINKNNGLKIASSLTSLAPRNDEREYYPVFREAPPTMERGEVDEDFHTGIKIIDTLIPIGKGQRILVFGDRMSGKTSIGTDAIINQSGKDVVCIYCSIGKSYSSLLKVVQLLKKFNCFEYTTIVAAGASSPCAQQYLAPYAATAIGEYFMHKGKDVFLVFDDLTKHAWAYRQISLLLERPPGREAYPGDIYYIHSQLLERAGKLSEEKGAGSMTLFCMADTLQGDVAGYIPSNLISMLDGQVYLSTTLFAEGFKPAIDFGASVSIIGARTQHPAIKEAAGRIRIEYAQYRELLKLTRLKSALSPEAEAKIRRGEIISELLKQNRNNPASLEEQIILFYAFDRNVLDKLPDDEIRRFKKGFFTFVEKAKPGVIGDLKERQTLKREVIQELDESLKTFFAVRRA